METPKVGQGQFGDLICRRCLHWKRVGYTWGDCYGHTERRATTESDHCDRFTPKTIMTTVNRMTGWISPSGAKSSYEMPRYDLIPPEFVRRLAQRMAYGAAKHGENNYQRGVGDAAFHRDRVNHLIEHVLKYVAGDREKDHLAAVAANAAMLMWLDSHTVSGEQGHSINP